MDAVGWEAATLSGILEGGLMAQQFAIRHPERVERLVLVNTLAPSAEPAAFGDGRAVGRHLLSNVSVVVVDDHRIRIIEVRVLRWRHVVIVQVALTRPSPIRGATEIAGRAVLTRPWARPVATPSLTRNREAGGAGKLDLGGSSSSRSCLVEGGWTERPGGTSGPERAPRQ